MLQQLAQLVAIASYHIMQYLPDIVDILCDFWRDHLEYVLEIVQQVASKMTTAFILHLPTLLPLLLSSVCVPTVGASSQLTQSALEQAFKPLEQTLTCFKALRDGLEKISIF